jgi:uncharacterized membrane protein
MDTVILHPMAVHFPIALLMVGFLFDVISLFFKKEKCLSKAGLYLMILGTLGAVAAVMTGMLFSKELTGFGGHKKEIHEMFAVITLIIMLLACIVRIIIVSMKKEESSLKWVVFLLFAAGTGFVAYTGLLGGKLVYEVML